MEGRIIEDRGAVRKRPTRLGVARTASPDAHSGHPALRSLPASIAFGILPSLVAKAGSIGTGNPSLNHLCSPTGGPLFFRPDGRQGNAGHGWPRLPVEVGVLKEQGLEGRFSSARTGGKEMRDMDGPDYRLTLPS